MDTDHSTQPDSLLSADELLPAVFGKKDTPSLRWLRTMTKRRTIPHYKLGRLVRYDPAMVRAALAQNCLVTAKTGKEVRT